MDDTLKAHLFYSSISLLLGGLVAIFCYLSVVSINEGMEYLSVGNLYEFGLRVLLCVGWAFTAAVIAYILVVIIKMYLDVREYKIPDVCPKCKESIHSSDVEWIEEDMVKCPHCEIVLKVPKSWQ
jgi:hypothetical protein